MAKPNAYSRLKDDISKLCDPGSFTPEAANRLEAGIQAKHEDGMNLRESRN